MSLKKNPLNLFVLVFILVLVSGVVGSVFLRNYKEQKSPEKFSEDVVSTEGGYQTFPQILNEPVRNISIGSTFTFSPRVAPMDETVKLYLLDAPAWLILDDSLVTGTPTSSGPFSFVVRLEKDGQYIDEEFFLVVTEGDNE